MGKDNPKIALDYVSRHIKRISQVKLSETWRHQLHRDNIDLLSERRGLLQDLFEHDGLIKPHSRGLHLTTQRHICRKAQDDSYSRRSGWPKSLPLCSRQTQTPAGLIWFKQNHHKVITEDHFSCKMWTYNRSLSNGKWKERKLEMVTHCNTTI